MKDNKYTLRKKIQYELDEFISKGFWAQLALLVGCVGCLVFFFAVILMIFAEGEDFSESLWTSLMHIIDQGTITGDDTDNTRYLIFMLGITFLGMAFTSAIIGIISNAVQNKMSELNKGHSRIIEKNHVVVLGFNESTHTIRNEIEESNDRKRGNHTIVIADEMSKEEMEHLSREVNWNRRSLNEDEETAVKKEKKTTTMFRSGDLVSENTFVICAADRARAVIVNGDDDFETIRILLALTAYLKKMNAYIGNDNMPSVVALVKKRENLAAAKIAAGVYHEKGDKTRKEKNENKVRILYLGEILAKLFGQVCVQPGLSLVMSDLINYNNASFYIEKKYIEDSHADMQQQTVLMGKNIIEITGELNGVTPVGFARIDDSKRTHMMLNPGPDVRYTAGDMLVYLADDEDDISIRKENAVTPVGSPADKSGNTEKDTRNFLILGRSSSIPGLLRNMSEYCEEGSGIDIIAPADAEYDEDSRDAFNSCNIIADDPYNWDHTRRHLKEHPYWFDRNDHRHLTNMVILSSDDVDNAAADEGVMVLLLNIRNYIKKNCDYSICITTEIRQPQDQALMQSTSINDFVVSTKIADRLLVQVAEDPKKYYIFEELLKQDGKSVILKPFSDYVDVTKPFNFEGIVKEVFRKGSAEGRLELPIGWIVLSSERSVFDEETYFSGQLILNPVNEERSRLFTDDSSLDFDSCRLILLADHC